MATALELPSSGISDAKTSDIEREDETGQGSKKITRIREEEASVEVTMDVREDSVAIENIKTVERTRLSSLPKSVSTKVLHMTQELRQKVSTYRRPQTLDRSKSGAARALKGLQFVTKNVGTAGWPEVERRFNELAVDGVLLRSRFGQCIGMKESESKEFAMQVYDALARRKGITAAVLTKEELRAFWEQLSDQSFDARLKTFFDMVDKNADGQITQEEVKEIITLSASANKLLQIKEHADEYAALIMEEFDKNHLGYIELANLEKLLLEEPTQATNKSDLSRLLSKQLVSTKVYNPFRRCGSALFYLLEDNWKRIWVIALWLSICAGLFAWKFLQYQHRAVFHIMGYCVTTAKGAAEMLKFNMALILLPVCRNTITWLRSKTKIGAVVPFNDSINFHMIIAAGIAVGVGLHAVAHLMCDFPRLLHASDAEYEPMEPFFGKRRPPNYWWFVKGTEGWTGVVMVVLMSVAFVLAQPWFRRDKISPKNPLRRLAGFNAFWYSHHLFVIVYALLIVHGTSLYLSRKWYKKTTWMYLAIPVTLYACERLLRSLRSSSETVRIQKAAVYPEKVLALYLSKPQGFRYRSGQYIFVKCDRISSFEWHPFSISSAPGDDYLSIHINAAGDWTSELRDIFSQVCQPPAGDKSGVRVAEDNPGFPRLLIDGPYGAPAQDYWHYDVLLLIGLGIGATPLISIVKDVLHNIERKEAATGRDMKNGGTAGKADGNEQYMTQRVYFYWMTREQGSFQWFQGVMNEVAEKDMDGVIELHNHCTSVYEEGDARSALILMLQSLHHAKNGVDVVSGTRVKTHFAKPSWRSVFKHVAANHENQRVGVFYCGRPELIRELRWLAQEFSRKTGTKFDFHKENF